jgi:hypothetical protein
MHALIESERRSDDPHLLDDLPAFQIAPEPEPTRRAKRTFEGASDLRAHAHAKPSGPFERYADCFDGVTIDGGQRKLDEGVEHTPLRRPHLERGKTRASVDSIEGRTSHSLNGTGTIRRSVIIPKTSVDG